MMAYVNPIPTVDPMGKNFVIRPVFRYEEPSTIVEAAEGINREIEENGGKILIEWICIPDK